MTKEPHHQLPYNSIRPESTEIRIETKLPKRMSEHIRLSIRPESTEIRIETEVPIPELPNPHLV